jgi:hypothetical protein
MTACRAPNEYRALAVIDQWARESLVIEVDVSLTSERIKRVLDQLRVSRNLAGSDSHRQWSRVYRPRT